MSTSNSASIVQAVEFQGTGTVSLAEQSTSDRADIVVAVTSELRGCTGLLWQAQVLGCCKDLASL